MKLVGHQTQGADAINKALIRGMRTHNRQATIAHGILFFTRIGRDIMHFVKSFSAYRRAPLLPVLFSFIFCLLSLFYQAAAGSRCGFLVLRLFSFSLLYVFVFCLLSVL